MPPSPGPPRPSGPGAPWPRGTGRGCCAASPPPSTPTSTSWPGSRWPTPATSSANARWEAGNVRDVLEFYAGAPERQSGKQIPVPGGIDVTFYEPLGVVGVIVPWNFPDGDCRLGLRAGAGGRQHRGPQAGRAHAAQRAAHRRAGARGGVARGRAADPAGKGERRRTALRGPPRRAQGLLHRLDRGRAFGHGGLRGSRSSG